MILMWVQEGLVATCPGIFISALGPSSFIINNIH